MLMLLIFARFDGMFCHFDAAPLIAMAQLRSLIHADTTPRRAPFTTRRAARARRNAARRRLLRIDARSGAPFICRARPLLFDADGGALLRLPMQNHAIKDSCHCCLRDATRPPIPPPAPTLLLRPAR